MFTSNFSDKSRPYAAWSSRAIELRINKLSGKLENANDPTIARMLQDLQGELDHRETLKLQRMN